MKNVLRCLAMVLAGSVAAASSNVLTAQISRNKPPVRFEAVSIKRTPPGAAPGRAGLQPGGRYVLTNGPIRILIDAAYPTDSSEIIDAPDWVMREPYDVTAVAGRDVVSNELAEMMREMLAERFMLVARVERRERPVFALVRANADGRLGPSLRPTTDCLAREASDTPGPDKRLAPCRQSFGPGRMESTGFSMEGLAFNLSYAAGRKVIDRTGLKGDYEFALEYAPAPTGRGIENPGDKPNVFTALREQLGLSLQPDVASLSIVVIDGITRPTPN